MKLRAAVALPGLNGSSRWEEDDLVVIRVGHYSRVLPTSSFVPELDPIELNYQLKVIKSLVFVKATDTGDDKYRLAAGGQSKLEMVIRTSSTANTFHGGDPEADPRGLILGKVTILQPIVVHDGCTVVRVDCPAYQGKYYDDSHDLQTVRDGLAQRVIANQ